MFTSFRQNLPKYNCASRSIIIQNEKEKTSTNKN